MATIRGVDLHMDMANGELTIHLPGGRNIAFAARAYVGDVLITLEQHAAQQTSGNVYHHVGNQPAHHSPKKGIVRQPGSGVRYDATAEQIHTTSPPASEPQPAPCGWCGFTTGHAPSCAFVPRDARDA